MVVIVVVNTSDSGDTETTQLLAEATSACSHAKDNLYLSTENSLVDCLIVDRASVDRQFREEDGVGLARKIGADIALSMITAGLVSNPFINNTDADALLPPDYFGTSLPDSAVAQKEVSAIVRPFRHVHRATDAEPIQSRIQASLLYEISLYYYVSRLKHANSPYAFHTIGSTIAVNARDYALV